MTNTTETMSKPNDNSPLARLRHHVTGAIERGEATPIVAQAAQPQPPQGEQPGTKDIDMALALDKAHTQKNYAEGQLAIARREIDALQSQRDELLEACKLEVCERLGSVEQGFKWAEVYRDGHAGEPDKGLVALVDAIARATSKPRAWRE